MDVFLKGFSVVTPCPVCSEFARLSEKPTISREEFLPVNYDHGDKESCVLEIFGKYFSKL